MKRNIFVLELGLCLLLLAACIITSYRKNTRAVHTGTFGNNTLYNDTLEDFANNIYSEFFHE